MKILVCVKRVPDPDTKIKLKADASGIETDGVKFVINPFDENAVEEAIKICEANAGSEVVVLSVGDAECITQIRTALAMGGTRGILIKVEGYVDSYTSAKLLAAAAKQEGFDIILTGKQAIDDDMGVSGQLIANNLGIPQITYVAKLAIANGEIEATREVDGGLEKVSAKLPVVVTAELRLNEPRYPSLPGIMKAKKKEVKEVTPADLGVALDNVVKITKMETPPVRQGGRKVKDVAELVDLLKNEAKVI